MSQTALIAGKTEGLLYRTVDWAFGYDFFISYAHADGLNYPSKLKKNLELAGYKVFLDKAGYVAGEELRRATRRRVSMSRKLVVIARPAALASEWVRREVDINLTADKTPIIINVNHSVENASDDQELAAIARNRDWLRIEEQVEGHDDDPTNYCIGELIRSFDATRQETRRLRFFGSTAVVLLLLTLSSVFATYLAIENAKKAELERDIAIARLLATKSSAALETKPELGLLLAVESVRTTLKKRQFWLPSAEQALRKALSSTGGWPLRLAEEKMELVAVSASAKESQIAVADNQGMIHLWNLSSLQNSPTTFRAHITPVKSLTFSGDGKLIVTASGHSGLKLWNLSSIDSGPLQVLEANSGDLEHVSFSPDSQWLAAASEKALYVWDIRENELIHEIKLPDKYHGMTTQVSQLRFSSDSQWLALIFNKVTGLIVNLFTKKSFLICIPDMYISEVGFSPDSKFFAVGTGAGYVSLIKIGDLIDVKQIYSGVYLNPPLGGAVHSLAFSPKENRLAVGSGGPDRTIVVWDIDDLGPAKIVLRGSMDKISSLVFSPDGKRLASGSGDCKVRIWDIEHPNDQPIILRGHEGTVMNLFFSYDGRQLITRGADNSVRVWQVSNLQAEPTVLGEVGSSRRVRVVAFSPNARFLAVGSEDGTLTLWNREAKQAEARLIKGWGGIGVPVYAIDISADGQLLVAGVGGEKPLLWNLNKLQERIGRADYDYFGGSHIDMVQFSPNGQWAATRNDNFIARLWSVDKKSAKLTDTKWLEKNVQALAFSVHDAILAVGRKDGVVTLWNLHDLQEEQVAFKGHNGVVNYLSFHPTGRLLVTAGNDRTVRLWDIRNPERDAVVLRLNHGDIYFIKFSREGDLLAVTVGATNIQVMKNSGKGFKEIFSGKLSGSISQVALSSDNKKLVARSGRVIQIWDLNSHVVEPVVLEGHTNLITTMDLSRDAKWLATGGQDNAAQVWGLSIEYLMNAACRVAGRSLSPDERELSGLSRPK